LVLIEVFREVIGDVKNNKEGIELAIEGLKSRLSAL